MAQRPNPSTKAQPRVSQRPLSPQDTETQTLGCRHANPAHCQNNSLPECAFAREDRLCLIPPRSWRRKYQALKAAEAGTDRPEEPA